MPSIETGTHKRVVADDKGRCGGDGEVTAMAISVAADTGTEGWRRQVRAKCQNLLVLWLQGIGERSNGDGRIW